MLPNTMSDRLSGAGLSPTSLEWAYVPNMSLLALAQAGCREGSTFALEATRGVGGRSAGANKLRVTHRVNRAFESLRAGFAASLLALLLQLILLALLLALVQLFFILLAVLYLAFPGVCEAAALVFGRRRRGRRRRGRRRRCTLGVVGLQLVNFRLHLSNCRLVLLNFSL